MHPQRLIAIVGLSTSLLLAPLSFAASIKTIKGKQVLIENESTEMVEGQKYFVIIDGKKRAVVVITKVKGSKSLGRITKGRAEEGAEVEPAGSKISGRSGNSSGKSSGESEGDDDALVSKSKRRSKRLSAEPALVVGAIAGYAMDSQTVTVATTSGGSASVAMAGTGYSIKGYGDWPLSGSYGLIGRAGLEQMQLSGSSGSTGSVNTSILYGTVDALFRLNYTEGNFSLYGAAGFGINYPLGTPSSNILDQSKISLQSVVILTPIAMNYRMNETTYITALGEYVWFPPSQSVSTNIITVRGGMGWRY